MEVAITPDVIAVKTSIHLPAWEVTARHGDRQAFGARLIPIPSARHVSGAGGSARAMLRAYRAKPELPGLVVCEIVIKRSDLLVREVSEPFIQSEVVLRFS